MSFTLSFCRWIYILGLEKELRCTETTEGKNLPEFLPYRGRNLICAHLQGLISCYYGQMDHPKCKVAITASITYFVPQSFSLHQRACSCLRLRITSRDLRAVWLWPCSGCSTHITPLCRFFSYFPDGFFLNWKSTKA